MDNNYSIGSRDIETAGGLFADRAYESGKSQALVRGWWVLFIRFLRERLRITYMENVTQQMVLLYACDLLQRNWEGSISKQTMRCYLSAVNVILFVADPSDDRRVYFSRNLGLPREPRKTLFNRGDRYSEALCESLPPRVYAMTCLHREFGMRFEEGAKIDAREAWREARETGQITISKGTKGGKERIVPIRNSMQQLRVLCLASEFQGDHKSLIPCELSYKKFNARTYGAAYRQGVKFHDARHAYAQSTYRQLTSWPPPISLMLTKRAHKKFVLIEYGVSESHFIKRDRFARRAISKELGHERIQITSTYLG